MTIFIVGYMGCGKSTVGRMIASRLKLRFVDMDAEIERAQGMTVGAIFEQRGEPEFRRLESEFLREKGALDSAVVATGGGVPCRDGNMELMNELGHTVYLKMCPRSLVGRLGPGRAKRPLISGMDDVRLLEFIAESLAVREQFYSRAHMTIDCDGVNEEYVAGHVERYIDIIGDKK